MEWWQIVLLVIGIIHGVALLFYLLGMILIFIYLCVNSIRIRLKGTVINSILAQQYDLIRLLRIMIEEEKIELPNDVYVYFELHNKEKMKKKDAHELMEIKSSLSEIANRLIIIADSTSLVNTKKYEAIKQSLNEFSSSYRKEKEKSVWTLFGVG